MAMTPIERTSPYLDSTPLLADPPALRARAAQDGYLYFKRLLDPAAVLNVRRQVLAVAHRHGWLAEAAPLMEGVARPGVCFFEGQMSAEWKAYYGDIQRLRDFHALALNRALLELYEKLFGETAVLHSRNICRTIFPQSTLYTTPAHQDFVHIKGTPETWTAWIPAGDCPADLGGLAIVPGSQRRGELPTRAAYGAGGAGVDVPADSLWVLGELACGDVLTFHSLTVHQGRDNRTPDKLRISFDYRYQPLSQPMARISMSGPHQNWLTWEQVYAAWPANDPVKYYWQNWDLNYV